MSDKEHGAPMPDVRTRFVTSEQITWKKDMPEPIDYLDAAIVVKGETLEVVSDDGKNVVVKNSRGHIYPANPDHLEKK